MRVVIFSGTTEGRALSRLLAEEGAAVTVCVATDYGREEQGSFPGITVLTGRKGREEMAEALRGADLCVDATHPYAVEATETIRDACADAGIPCRRLLRPAEKPEGAVVVENAAEAAAFLAGTEGAVLLTTGSKELSAFRNLDPARLYPRVLPTHEALDACEALGIPHRNILALQGPFSRELNEALIRQYRVRYLVTKDGGAAGGFPEKAEAASRTGAVLILLRRPKEKGESFDDVSAYCRALLRRERQAAD